MHHDGLSNPSENSNKSVTVSGSYQSKAAKWCCNIRYEHALDISTAQTFDIFKPVSHQVPNEVKISRENINTMRDVRINSPPKTWFVEIGTLNVWQKR